MLLDGLVPAFGGAAAGSLLAIAAAQLIRSSLYATKPSTLACSQVSSGSCSGLRLWRA